MKDFKKILLNNITPIVAAIIVFIGLVILFFGEITGLNQLTFVKDKILTSISWVDVLVGLTIYLKTSIDFAIFIGFLMTKYPGLKNRFAIEIGTAFGNMLGTALVLALWVFFKEISILLGIMVLLASLVLFEMAASSLEHMHEDETPTQWQLNIVKGIEYLLKPILFIISPVLSKVMPNLNMNKDAEAKGFWGLFLVSFTVPFILGLDDFAGYVPLFNVVNVFGFGIGVFLGHCILNILLFISPSATTKIIKNPNIAILGALAFIALGVYGLYEAFKIFFLGH
jgi:hypothetical protein